MGDLLTLTPLSLLTLTPLSNTALVSSPAQVELATFPIQGIRRSKSIEEMLAKYQRVEVYRYYNAVLTCYLIC